MHSFNNKQLLKSGALYSIASTLSAVCAMAVGFLNMRWLGPELLGIWQSVTILNAYLPFVQLGIQSGLNLELPIVLGENNKEKALKYVSTALSYAIGLSIALFVLSIVSITILTLKVKDDRIVLGLVVVCIMTILSCFKLHYIATYRSANAFNRLANIYWVDSALTLLLIILIYIYQYYGLLLSYAIKEIVFTIIMYVYAPYRNVKPSFDKSCFKDLFKRGIVMTLVNEVKGIIESMSRVLLLRYGGTLMVGLFSPATVVGTFINLIPTQIAQFLHPQFGMKYGQSKQARDMWPYFLRLTIWVPLCLIPVSILGWLLIPYALEFFPKYHESLWPIRIMMFGFLFSTTFFSRGFLITIKAYYSVFMLYFVDFLFFGGLSLLFIKLYPVNMLVSLCVALSISYFITYIINIIVVYYTIHLPKYNNEKLINS